MMAQDPYFASELNLPSSPASPAESTSSSCTEVTIILPRDAKAVDAAGYDSPEVTSRSFAPLTDVSSLRLLKLFERP